MAQIFISKELKEKLILIQNNSEVAKLLLKGDVNSEILADDYINYISIDKNEPGRLSFLNRERYDLLRKKGDEDVWTSSMRYSSKPGALVNKIFKSISNKEVENFAALIKAALASSTFKFKIVEGENIRKWYLYDSYSSLDRGSLGASCLRHPHSQPLLDFYVANNDNIKLLLMVDNEDRLLGRALLWYFKDSVANRIMDRIYTNNSDDEFHFKQWADQNGFIYKSKQNWNTPYIFESKGEVKKIKMSVTLPKMGFKYMPYLDTFKWLDVKTNVFTNYLPDNRDSVRTFVATNGSSYPANHLAMDELDEHYWQQDEIVNIDYLKLRTKNTNVVWSDICQKYILSKDSNYDEDLGDYIFNTDYHFLNPIDRINQIKEQKKIAIERKKLKLTADGLRNVQQLSNILMEYYRTGELNINENDASTLREGLNVFDDFYTSSVDLNSVLGTFRTHSTRRRVSDNNRGGSGGAGIAGNVAENGNVERGFEAGPFDVEATENPD